MSAELILTKNHPEIHGEFWVPGEKERQVGFLRLEAGKGPDLELAEFTGLKRSALIERIRRDQRKCHGDGHRVMHGIDENGEPITLIDCYEAATRSTRARLTRTIRCDAAIFGVHLSANKLKFRGLFFRLDHQDEWLNRSALGPVQHDPIAIETLKDIRLFRIPVSETKTIDLKLPGYRRSRFDLWWSIGPQHRNFTFGNSSYFDLIFETGKTWDELRGELQSWKWLLSLATRTNVDVEAMFLKRDEIPAKAGASEMKLLPVWIARSVGLEPLNPKHTDRDYHFTFDHIESVFADIHSRWRAMAQPWAAVLHRFVAITSPRDLWLNEQFLFLAQATEALYRARTGKKSQIDFLTAARQAWDQSPAELRLLLGPRDLFASRLRKSRNYWTHYGQPGPADDPEIVDGDGLIEFNEQLRWVVEAAILRQIGIPDANVSRVWNERWRLQRINFA